MENLDQIIKEPEIKELTPEQQKIVLDAWNKAPSDKPPTLKDLAVLCFGGNKDGRSKETFVLKKFLAERSIKVKTNFQYAGPEIPPLSEEQKIFIANHASTMTAVEMARELYDDKKLTNLNRESVQVSHYLNGLPNIVLYKKDADKSRLGMEDYNPPKRISEAAVRVNKYILNCITPEEVEKSTKIKHFLEKLITFMHMHRYLMLVRGLESPIDRELFESEYVRFIYGKPDLGEMDLDLVCNVCCDVVNYTNMQQELDGLKAMREQCADDSDGKRISMSIVESISGLRSEMDNNHKRQVNAFKILEGSRNERINLKLQETTSVISLIEAWKEESERKRLIKFAEDRRKECQNEVKKLDTLDSFVAEIFGLNKETFEN